MSLTRSSLRRTQLIYMHTLSLSPSPIYFYATRRIGVIWSGHVYHRSASVAPISRKSDITAICDGNPMKGFRQTGTWTLFAWELTVNLRSILPFCQPSSLFSFGERFEGRVCHCPRSAWSIFQSETRIKEWFPWLGTPGPFVPEGVCIRVLVGRLERSPNAIWGMLDVST